TFLLYISIALAQGFHLFGRLTFSRWQYRVGSLLVLCGHGWLLYRYIEMPEGQNLYWLCMLSFTLWLMNILTLFASFRAQVENLSSLTFPLSALSLALVMHFAGSDIMDTKAHPGVLA
ncbi:MAG TPA: hypothetical protein PLD88_13120, partial [Candidatus Berkiella sp.]|nr:hypothetical protein [Candidatus Berkiella sp.]